MSDNKKYYYLKLKEDFFQSDEVLFLENMPEGYKYSNILLKLYLKSLKNNGKLMMNNIIPYNAEMLATITRHSVGDVKQAIQIFNQLGLVEQLDNGAIYMLQIQNFIGKSSTEGDRKRAYRKQIEQEKGQMLNGKRQKSGHLSDNRPPELELELDKELNLELDLLLDKDTSIYIKGNPQTYTQSYPQEEIEYLEKLELNNKQIQDILRVLKESGKGLDFLEEKVKLTQGNKNSVKENVGYLIQAIREDWKKVKNNNYKTKFHNFDTSDQYTEEALRKAMRKKWLT